MNPSEHPHRSPHPFDVAICSEVATALRSGYDVPDSAFDLCLPSDLRALSSRHWTPLEVARKASEWVEQLGVRTIVDIGAGVGKFCVATALLSNAKLVGIEQRAGLVTTSRQLAAAFGVDRQVTFEWGIVGRRPIPRADAYYLYNPFGENLTSSEHRIDASVELSRDRYEHDVEWVRHFLHGVPLGTHVITYNGYGALLPSSFFEVRSDRGGRHALRISRKVSAQ